MTARGTPLLEVRDLRTHFPVRKGLFGKVAGVVRAVDGVSLAVRRSETLGLVGETGCGKTTLGRTILRLERASGGSVRYSPAGGDGAAPIDVLAAKGKALRALRRHLQIVFQDPYGSLDPRQTVGSIVAEPLRVHRRARGEALRARVAELLALVGLSPDAAPRYPHEFSGGQRQRVGIARALALRPSFVVCDEPVSALDVSVQAQILNLLADLQAREGVAYLFVAHDLAVVRSIAHRVAVMYLGEIVEEGPTDAIFGEPLHPYTKALLSAVPVPDPMSDRKRIVLAGEPPSPLAPPPGCRFHPRCPWAEARCRTEVPEPRVPAPGRVVSCHLVAGEPVSRKG